MNWIEQKMRGRKDEGDSKSDRWGAFGVGLVLVLLPSLALFFGAEHLKKHESIGLPVVAVFGVMVLVGALAITSTLFRRLKLTSRKQPLALPPGSVRATIALALIVLFSIIAIAAMRPPQELKHLVGVSGTARAEILRDPRITVAESVLEGCASTKTTFARDDDSVIALPPSPAASAAPGMPATTCTPANERYSLIVKVGPDTSNQDLVKQLVLMIGQLMTMAVSFYFAGRNAGQDKGTTEDTATTGSPGAKKLPGQTSEGVDKPAPKPDSMGAAPVAETPKAQPTEAPIGAAAAGAPTAPAPEPGATGSFSRIVPGPSQQSGTTFDLAGLASGSQGAHDAYGEHEGCCAVGIRQTSDEDLPEAQGGIRDT